MLLQGLGNSGFQSVLVGFDGCNGCGVCLCSFQGLVRV